MSIQLTPNEEAKQASLRRMKMVATGLLLLMAAVFVASHYYRELYPWLNYVRAFAEAAMVGAMADWFAVTALFKHPLGLPIPHTAIIPKRKDEIGESLAQFIKENFLIADVLKPRLQEYSFANHVAEWLSKEDNAKRLTQDSTKFAHWMFDAVDNKAIKQFIREHLQMSLREIPVTPFIGRILDLLTLKDRHQTILDAALRAAWTQLQENKHRLRDKIDSESPWWVPSFVDKEIYNKISLELEQGILRIGSDEGHEARAKFNEGLAEFVEKLKNDPDVIRKGEEIKLELLEHPAFQGYLSDIWGSISSYMLKEIDNPESQLRGRIESGIQSFGKAIIETPELQEQINTWLNNATLHVVTNYRDEISNIITDTVKSWDAEVTSQRVELQVGRDLQFIRINGTLVGGIVGLLIYVISHHFMS